MTTRYGSHYPKGISGYVPDMQFAADVLNGRAVVDFGAPVTLDVDGIINDGAVTSTAKTFTQADFAATIAAGSFNSSTTALGELDAKWGRCLTYNGTGSAANAVVTVTGRDYLGTRIRESKTLTGSTAVQGDKAFKHVDTVAIAAGADSTTSLELGWNDRLGLPYKSFALTRALDDEDDVANQDSRALLQNSGWAPSVSTAAGIASWTVPFDGYITGFEIEATTGIGSLSLTLTFTGASLLDGSYGVVGTSVPVGGKVSKTLPTSAWIATTKGTVVTAVNSLVTASGAGIFNLLVQKGRATFTAGDETTATSVTKDTRGLYQPHIACNGTRTFLAEVAVDDTELHGIPQF